MAVEQTLPYAVRYSIVSSGTAANKKFFHSCDYPYPPEFSVEERRYEPCCCTADGLGVSRIILDIEDLAGIVFNVWMSLY